MNRIDLKIEKLKNKIQELESKHFEARLQSNQRFSNLGWGAGMRMSKIYVSTTKEDNLKKRIDIAQSELFKLLEIKKSQLTIF